MKKISLYLMALLSLALVSCDKDFFTEVGPQTNDQETTVQLSGVTMTTGVQAINIADFISEENGEADITIGTLKLGQALPANSYLEADVELSPNADFSDSIRVKALDIDSTYQINLRPSTLQDAYFNGITRNPAQQQMYVRTIVYVVTGGESVATIGDANGIKYFDPHTVMFTPLFKVKISPAYYIVGGPNSDWAGSAAAKAIKFNHSDLDVYEDPIFTVTFDAAASGDTWFAIGDDEACAAVGSGDWSQLLGIVGGDNEAKEGKLDTRANMGADNSFKVAEGAKKIKVTLDMMNYTFKVEPVSIADAYYLVGGPGSWSSDKSQKFSHSSLSVFEDPVFTYTFAGNEGTGDIWFAFGDAAALDAIDSNDWMQLYGYVGELGESGSFDRRANIGAENTFHVDGKADFYRFTINMSENTYMIEEINIAAQYYVVGGVQGWSDSKKTCLFTPENQKNVLSYTTKWTGAWDLKVWDADHFGNWDAAWGCAVDGDNSPSGALINSGAQAISAPSADFYTFTIDMNTMTYTWTKLADQAPTEYTNISLIGEFNGWAGDFELEQVTPHNWYAVFTQETDGQLKFRANHDWNTNWGYGGDKEWNVADSFNKIGTNGGGNIWVPAGTYAVYLNDITSSMLIVAQ